MPPLPSEGENRDEGGHGPHETLLTKPHKATRFGQPRQLQFTLRQEFLYLVCYSRLDPESSPFDRNPDGVYPVLIGATLRGHPHRGYGT